MPDLLSVFSRRWKLFAFIIVFSTLVAFIIAISLPKQYLSVATALPANSATADKARIFSTNIQALYSEFGTPDELDRFEGTAMLDTIFIAAVNHFNLTEHYGFSPMGDGWYKAVEKLKKRSKISRSGYGELKVKVWDNDRHLAAAMANFLMQRIQQLHQHLRNETNALVLKRVQNAYDETQQNYLRLADSLDIKSSGSQSANYAAAKKDIIQTKLDVTAQQLMEYQKMISEYQLALNTNPPVLLVVEAARPSVWPDKPRVLATVLFTFFGALLFSILVAVFVDSRKTSA